MKFTQPRHPCAPVSTASPSLRRLSALAVVLAVAAATAVPSALADSQTIDGVEWSYTVDGGNATVTGANPAEGNLAIPDTLGGATVTAIGDAAFHGCAALTGVEFPPGLTAIGGSAFVGCTELESVMFNGGGVTVGEDAFADCTNLVAVDTPSLAEWCGMDFDSPEANPLYFAKHLYITAKEVSLEGTLVISDGVARIGGFVFAGCSGLTGVSIPDSVANIGMGAFSECTSLAEMTIPDSVETLGMLAFEYCTSLSFLEVPGEWYGTTVVADAKVPETCEVVYRGIDPLSVKTTSLPRALVGAYYNAELSAKGGVSPYTWSAEFAEGAGFPEGLSLGETGRFQGVPEAAATCVFTAVATDAKGVSARRELVLEVAAGEPVEGVFERVTELDALEPGDYVITGTSAKDTHHYAMRNELGGTSTPFIMRNGEEPVAGEDDEFIIDPDASLVWTLEVGTAGWTLHNPDAGYVAFTGSKNAATFSDAVTSNSSWTVSAGGTEGLFAVANAAKPERILQYHATANQERFACYTNWGSRAQGLAFWKKGGTLPHAITIDPDIAHGTIATDPAVSAKPGTWVEVIPSPDTDGDWALQQVMVTGAISEQTWTYAGDPVTFEMPDEDVFVTALFTAGGTGPEEAFVFAGDQANLVGQEVSFTVEPKEEGAAFFLADFAVPEGSALTVDSLVLDYPRVAFTPDAAGTYWFVFELSEGEGFGAWSVEALSDEPGPGPGGDELRIAKMTIRDGTVTIEYEGTAGSVEGTDDLTGAADFWATVPGAAIDTENRTATLPQGKRFLRLSSEAPEEEEDTYLVVDLSGGAAAESWPVETLAEAPAGGWSDEYKTTKLVLRKIPAGTFTMGSPTNEVGRLFTWDEMQHQVTLTKPFYIGVFEVTQKQWTLATGSNPSSYAGDMRPVENVSYEDVRGASAGAGWPADNAVDAGSFLAIVRAKTGLAFDLPTEAQWEYACRAGTTTALNSGKDLTDRGTCPNMAEAGRYHGNPDDGKGGFGQHTAVGSYLPNAWGLYDMHGNASEWCLDYYLRSESSDAVVDPKGPDSGTSRVSRGGSWNRWAMDCRSAYQFPDTPSTKDYSSGLRLACPAEE